MTRSITPEMLNGFADEVRGYLRELAPVISSLDQASAESLELAYRRSHSIHGTAGLLNQFLLARLAQVQEETFEALMAGDLAVTQGVTMLLNQTFGGIARSIDFHLNRQVDQVEMLRSALVAQRRANCQPSDGDKAFVDETIQSVMAQISEPAPEPIKAEASKTEPAKKGRGRKSAAKKGANGTSVASQQLNPPTIGRVPVKPELCTTDSAAASNPEDDQLALDLKDQFAAIDNMDAEYSAIYQEDSEGLVAQLRDELDRLKVDPADSASVKTLRRLFHNLKGAAATVKLKPAATLAHRVEDVLDWLFDNNITTSAGVQSLLAHVVDALEDLASLKFDKTEMPARVMTLIKRLASAQNPTETLNDTESRAPAEAPAFASNAASSTVQSRLDQPNAATSAAFLKAEQASTIESRVEATLEALAPAFIDIDSALADSSKWSASMNPNKAASSSTSNTPARTKAFPATGEAIRIPLDSLDDMTRLVGELVVNRTGFEQRLTQLRGAVGELKLAMQRMQALSRKFDEHYEARALAKGSLLWPNAGGDEPRPLGMPGHALKTNNRLNEFDDLEFDRYTEFHLLSRQLAESISDLGTMGLEFGNMTGDFESLLTRQATISRDLQGRLMSARLLPLGGLMSRLKRVVRVAGETLNKAVEFDIDGSGVHLDKAALDDLLDPLTHLLRNAVAHGIESKETRAASGKPTTGRITMKAFHQGTQVVIEVTDDGAGFDLDALRAAAVRAGHLSADRAAAMDEADVRQLAFLHGLSTAAEVNEVSGRGVGLDVVKSAIHRLKGTVSLASTAGSGTTFTIRLPMTLALTKAMLVRVGDGTFAIPMQDVQQIVRIERSQLDTMGRAPVLRMSGRVFPLTSLADRLHQTSQLDPSSTSVPVLFVRTGDEVAAVAVDRIVAASEIVVKSLGTHLRKVHGFLGATFLGDGTVIPILNCFELLQTGRRRSEAGVQRHTNAGERASITDGLDSRTASRTDEPPTVMIVDDSVSVRRITAKLLGGAGMKTILARDGVDALEILQSLPEQPDLILLDVEMPRMDGYELLATLRGQTQYENLPVVMVTSRAGAKHRNKATDLGATEYLIKPYNEDDLVALIHRHVAASREMVVETVMA